jgi:hypothetical protein
VWLRERLVQDSMTKSTLKWISFVVLTVTFLSLSPQLRFWLFRGAQWHGAYVTLDGDEFLYSAYINALIDGRPRKNDPFSGRSDNPKAPLPESTFSIQFVPPFVIASLAKTFHASASTAFIVLMGAAGFLAASALFALLIFIVKDNRIAAVGTLAVVCFGTAAAGQGLLRLLIVGDASVGLMFLRRYQPAATFFLFFVFCLFVWRGLLAENQTRAVSHAAIAGGCLALLIFSYLYLWTAAFAWIACVGVLWACVRRREARRAITVVGMIAASAVLVFCLYGYLVSHRSANLTETQTLISTHQPDLGRVPEFIGFVTLAGFIFGARCRRISTDDPRLIFGLSFALLPLLLFNQQVITGKSIQAFHFQDFIANYVAVLALVVLVSFWARSLRPRMFVWMSVLCLLWGVIEVDLPAQARYTSDLVNDEMIPTLSRLKEFAEEDGTWSSLQNEGKAPSAVFSPHSEVMRLLPTWTPYGPLLGLGSLDFGTASRSEKRVYIYLYYGGVTTQRFADLLNGTSDDGFMNYYTRSAVFGHERVLPKLTYHFQPIQPSEIAEQVRFYDSYIASFSREEALKYPIAYLIVRADTSFDFSHIDLWYERDPGELVGSYYLYRLKFRVQ